MPSLFSKRHYAAIAAILYRNLLACDNDAERYMLGDVRNDMADLFAGDNPRFNRARFLKACGIQE